MASNLRPLILGHFRAAVEAHTRDWGVTDSVLYGLCSNQPGHDALSVVNAKSLLDGRSFATGIERHIKSTGSQGGSIGKLARDLQKNYTLMGRIINLLRGLKEPLDLRTL